MMLRTSLVALVMVVWLAQGGLGVPVPAAKQPVKEDGRPTALSPDGKSSATAKEDTITIVDLRNQVPVVRAQMKAGSIVRALAYSPDGKLLVSGGDQEVSMWSAAVGKQLFLFRHNHGAATALQFSADGRQLTITTTTGAQVVLEPATGKLLQVNK